MEIHIREDCVSIIFTKETTINVAKKIVKKTVETFERELWVEIPKGNEKLYRFLLEKAFLHGEIYLYINSKNTHYGFSIQRSFVLISSDWQ